MIFPRFTLILTIINLVLLIFLIIRSSLPSQPLDGSVLRAKLIELVDRDGETRASLRTEQDGQVVFRLLDASGSIRVKLGADQNGSGLVLLNDQTELGIQILSNDEGASLTLVGKDGVEQVIEP